MKARLLAISCALTVIALACGGERLVAGGFVRNRTEQAIDVYNVVNGEEVLLASLDKPLHNSFDQQIFFGGQLPGNCTTGDLVARAADGSEVARLVESLCVYDLWVIETDGSSSVRRG